jgi:hypothetical protein
LLSVWYCAALIATPNDNAVIIQRNSRHQSSCREFEKNVCSQQGIHQYKHLFVYA